MGVPCLLVELERRERERGDRTIGEGRSHLLDGVHTWGVYDFEVDTSVRSPQENACLIQAHSPIEQSQVHSSGCMQNRLGTKQARIDRKTSQPHHAASLNKQQVIFSYF
ncbi:MAG: hypothetical protein HC895_08815 [Leptolyngbyaceae cyanobacterium SM1_3_5]|nr:hypothetical protein [Leptolyngbyaceae cyanobacterium SM1_3_5]